MATQERAAQRRAREMARAVAGKPTIPKYAKPRVLLIDMADECESALRDAGYNVSVGTFGRPYSVTPSDKLCYVPLDSLDLPEVEEQDIVVVNTAQPTPANRPPNGPGEGVQVFWQRADGGTIDPRPLVMTQFRGIFDRILAHGGIAIVLLSARREIEYTEGATRHESIRPERELKLTTWSFLSELDEFSSKMSAGTQIEFVADGGAFGAFVKRGAAGARHSSTLRPAYQDESWLPLATNKFGDCVAGLLEKKEPDSLILVLPQMPQLNTILPDLLGTWCAQWRPQLFPFHEAQSWLYTEEYELPAITDVRRQIVRLKEAADAQVRELGQRIDEIRDENSDWYTLQTGTDSELVGAVIRALQRLGFTNVIDVDEQARANGEGRNLREDIQVHDQSLILIVDVKGIFGCPEDAEATQSEKHALMRAKEFKGDVKALTIINHERNLPPHERNPNPYRAEIIGNAEQTGLGLMTTWDVFRLMRNKELLSWPNEVVKPVFYRTGRIEPIPEHYVEVGTIVRVWQSAFGIVPSQAIATGAGVAVEVGDRFEELVADSLMVDDAPVTEALPGSNCGIACAGADERYRKGMRVFRIDPSS